MIDCRNLLSRILEILLFFEIEECVDPDQLEMREDRSEVSNALDRGDAVEIGL